MTVVEVVVSLALVSLVMISLWEGYNLAERSRRQSELQQIVAAVAEELLAFEGQMAQNDDEQVIDTDAGRLHCSWQVEAAPTAGVQEICLVITAEATGKQWCFVTERR